MSSKCINCGKTYNPDAYKFQMYGFGPECVKKFLSGELLYHDLVRDGKSPFGVSFDEYASKLSQLDQDLIKALLEGEQWEEFRDARYGVSLPLLKEYLLRSSPVAQATIFGRIANLIHHVNVRMAEKKNPEAYQSLGMDEAYEAYLNAFLRYRDTFKESDLPFAELLPRDPKNRSLLVHKALVRGLMNELAQDKELGDYNLDAFDSSSRYAFQLAKIGCGPDGVNSGIRGLAIQSTYDAMTDPNGENEFFTLSAYLNASTEEERFNSFPSSDILEGVVLAEAYLGTKQSDRTDNLRSVIERFRTELGEDGVENILVMDETMIIDRDGEMVEAAWEPIKASMGPSFMFEDHPLEVKRPPSDVSNSLWYDRISAPDSKFANSYLGKLRRGVMKAVYADGEKKSSLLARSELRRVLNGEAKLTQNSIAPLALAVSARRSEDGHFANVIRVKDGVIDKVMPARSMDLKLNEENFSASMKAHAALKKTFWTDNDFYKNSIDQGYEYFIATTGYSFGREEYRTSFHYKPSRLDSDNTVCDPHDLVAKGSAVEAGLLTQVWALDNEKALMTSNKSNYRFASCDRLLSATEPSKEDSEDIKKVKCLAIEANEIDEDDDKRVFNKWAPFGAVYQTGETMAIQVRHAKKKLPPMGESLSLLKDIELTATGYACANLHYDPVSIVAGGDIVSRRKTENPRNNFGKNEGKDKLKGYLKKLFLNSDS